MPSEQAMGQPTVRSDIYAVGVIAIQALTGINPNPKIQGLPIQKGEIVWRDRTHVKVSPKLANIIDTMVRYDYRQRYQSTDEVLQAIKALSPKSKTRPWKMWLSVGVVVAIAFVILWIVYQVINPKPKLSAYESSQDGIIVQYPEDWQPQKVGDFGGEVIKFVPKSLPSSSKQANVCPLEVTVNINNLSNLYFTCFNASFLKTYP
jgi:serine/threonine-protein kinase